MSGVVAKLRAGKRKRLRIKSNKGKIRKGEEMVELDRLLKEIRLKMAENPTFDYDELLEYESGKNYDIYATVDLAGAFVKDNRIKILARMISSQFHEDVIETALANIENAVKKRVPELIPGTRAEDLDVYLYDVENGEDIQSPR